MEKFIVSARKYRPLTFESVVGQHHITSTLKNAILRDQVAHAYLFCGPRGVGKTTCARILSKSINCLNPLSSGEACGECESCVAFNESRSFNIHELDAASNNSVENIRSLTEQVRIPPQIGKYSIYIIDEAHMLSTAAFNAFLKTLEEPPAHAIFILATTEKHKILPTILSRCQIYDFKRIKVEDSVLFLRFIAEKEGIISDDESLHIIAQKADGCMRDALSMFDKVVSFCGQNLVFSDVAEALNVLDYDSYFKFVEFYKSGDYQNALLQFDQIMQKGFEAMTFLGGLSGHIRNLLVAQDSSTLPLLEVTGTIAQRYSQQASNTTATLLFDSLNIISQSEISSRFSLNIRLHAEITILKLCNLSPLKLSTGSNDTNYTLPKLADATTVQPQQPSTPPPARAVSSVTKTATPPTPITQVEKPVEANSTQQQTTEVASEQKPLSSEPKQQSKSLLGLSINSMLNSQAKQKQGTPSKEENIKKQEAERASAIISPEMYDDVLAGCKKYAASLLESRPRIADAFSRSVIKDGVIIITVPNNILEEDLNRERHAIIEEMVAYCGVKKLTFEVEVDKTLEPERKVLLKDEDKLKFLNDENPSVVKLCKALDLDYI